MTLQELKNHILNKTVPNTPIIFKYKECNFIPNQYIEEIASQKSLNIEYIDDLKLLTHVANDIFASATAEFETTLSVIHSEVYIWGVKDLSELHNVILVVKKFADPQIESALKEYIVPVEELAPWMLKDYAYAKLQGIPARSIDQLLSLCGNNIFRLQQEIDKFTLFTVEERPYLFDMFLADGALNDLSVYNVFNLSNALQSKDIKSLIHIYRELDRIDISEFGLLTILLNNFRNLVQVQLSTNPTPESTGIDSRKLYALKRIPRIFSPEQLLSIYSCLCELDSKVKKGEIPTNVMVDYMILKILSI